MYTIKEVKEKTRILGEVELRGNSDGTKIFASLGNVDIKIPGALMGLASEHVDTVEEAYNSLMERILSYKDHRFVVNAYGGGDARREFVYSFEQFQQIDWRDDLGKNS